MPDSIEHRRLTESEARRADWKRWGPYLSERAWGTVREDYSAFGEAWEYFPHDHARSRAYRWNEDGLGGLCDRHQTLCVSVALWNERDPILKERLFGLTGTQGNHGEDVKEYYFYLDATPTHSYARMLYKYPQVAYPYADLVDRNEQRGKEESEYELVDAIGEALEQGLYFDVFIEHAKLDEEDLIVRITGYNRGPKSAPLHVLPHVWFRNRWAWDGAGSRPVIEAGPDPGEIHITEPLLGTCWAYAHSEGHRMPFLFTENDTNMERVFGAPNESPYVKDGINDAVVNERMEAVNPEQRGTKAAAHVKLEVPPGEGRTVAFRLAPERLSEPFADTADLLRRRIAEADAFYDEVQRGDLTGDERRVQRQAFAGLMWTKQFYHYDVDTWLAGDPAQPPPPPERTRNAAWIHLHNRDVLSMPDSWEYPWYAAWDLAFHMLPVAMIDPEWAKRQLVLLTREWYMHPNGQLPAYEWAFGDVNPPVHAWAAWRVYKIDRNLRGVADTDFLEKIFHKMLLNFTWWVNRKDRDGKNVFQGGFLGLDNIGVFDRSQPLPTGGHLEQADGTAWMGMFSLNMLAMALELAKTRPAYEDVATKFFEHFVYIAHSINRRCGGSGLWDPDDGFYYDAIHCPSGAVLPLKVKSLVGLIPLFAAETIEPELLERLPGFRRRMEWFMRERPHLLDDLSLEGFHGGDGRCLLSLVNERQLERILGRMLDPDQFLSDHGLRSLSKEHADHPFIFTVDDRSYTVSYEPGESRSGLFGGNSNWRGPIWFPVNYLMIESLQKFHHYYGDRLTVALPAGSGSQANLWSVSVDLSRRLNRIFLKDEAGRRPVFGDVPLFQTDPHWRDYPLFYEYFHGETGAGLGASHQTGWTSLVAKLLQQSGGNGGD